VEREEQVRVSLRSVEGCGSNGQKLHKMQTIAGLQKQSNSRRGKCCQVLATKPPNFFSLGVVLSQSTFHLVTDCVSRKGNVRLSAPLFSLYFLNRLTFEVEFLCT